MHAYIHIFIFCPVFRICIKRWPRWDSKPQLYTYFAHTLPRKKSNCRWDVLDPVTTMPKNHWQVDCSWQVRILLAAIFLYLLYFHPRSTLISPTAFSSRYFVLKFYWKLIIPQTAFTCSNSIKTPKPCIKSVQI